MYESFSGIFKKMLLSMGFDVRRVPKGSKRLIWLKNQRIKTVIDIGAHKGQFATMMHKVLPDAKIYSFEPLKDCYEKLVKNMGNLSDFEAFNYALGDRNTKTKIHRSSYSQSSSLLPMGESHKEAFPYSKGETTEKIKVKKLDEVAKDLDIEKNVLVKIDVQGYEDRVIEGGKKFISNAQVLIVETSFETLYKGQPLFDKVYEILKKMGFSYRGSMYQISSPADGKVLQSDSIFVKN